MRTFLLFIALISLGVQAEMLLKQSGFSQTMFGSTEDAIIFFGLGIIEALIFVIWLVSASYEIGNGIRRQRNGESWAEVGLTSRLPRVRGMAIARLINALSDRAALILTTLRRHGLPFLLFAIVFASMALAMMHFPINGN